MRRRAPRSAASGRPATLSLPPLTRRTSLAPPFCRRYPPAAPSGSPDAAYRSISLSESVLNHTSVETEREMRAPLRASRSANPVTMRCFFPLKARSIARACARFLGFPYTARPATASVSAPMSMASSPFRAAASAFCAARRFASVAGESAASSRSRKRLFRTSKCGTSFLRSVRRADEPDARTIRRFCLFFFSIF
ncbi:MAG: hypothetical protein UY98_C0029G0001 [Candidatus Kaiserbacteria bacterium GW2011_GWA2_58_9]|uniref:Uncharacterized protein n=1 Tax=Candidatus Kaiserbacteria bacterium GW2011_GWA2_58_9 TaxID=1618672 RepID=A0A0G2BKL0_9BACT|nr:MAG: hypothetical protein UY98_C0029G0001 [Candidatus Kaiserbacteria bacterium GW2011_GWA2_58_9]